ncbi:MAG: NPCBM/NEW2 domain-containing protein [Planctomycetota bacterium]
MRVALAIALALSLPVTVFAQLRVVQTDGSSIDAEILKIDPEAGVSIDTATVIPWDQIVRVDRTSPALDARRGTFALHLRGGGRLVGRPIETVGETLHFDDANVGEIAVDLSAIAGMVPYGQSLPSMPSATDVLRLANDDVLRGVVLELDADQATIQTDDGQTIAVELATVTRLQLAPLGPTPDVGRYLVHLGGGWAYPVSAVTIERGALRLTIRRPEGSPAEPFAPISKSWLDQIEQVGGPVRFVSDLTPTDATMTPYLAASDAGTTVPYLVEERNLRVRPRSTLTFDIPEGFTHLRFGYELAPGHRPLGDVSVRVLLDGVSIHEARNVTSAVAVRLDLDIAGGSSLTLEVDYGENFDVQDELLWLEPTFLKR